jgi:hypothetical protein
VIRAVGRLGAALLALGALAGCAAMPPGPALGLTGWWEGRSSGPGGSAPIRLLIKEDGTYVGALRADEERPIHGAITELPSGRLRFDSNSGSGTIIRRQRGGERLLRFERDDGYPLFEVVPRAEPPKVE